MLMVMPPGMLVILARAPTSTLMSLFYLSLLFHLKCYARPSALRILSVGSHLAGPPSSRSNEEGACSPKLLRLGCLNVRGIKANNDYVANLLGDLDILAISEHWLHSYDLHLLGLIHTEYNYIASSPHSQEDALTCAPRLKRGCGGVAILWRKAINNQVKKLTDFSNDRCVAIQLLSTPRPLAIISTYLPCRSGCTDLFKEALDYVDSIINHLAYDHSVIVLGDLNADPGPDGGPLSTTPANEQGRILLRYLAKWELSSVHLHTCSTPHTHTYTSEAHNSTSTIDHLLAPVHLLPSFSNCCVIEDDPLNLSDHSPVCASLKIYLPSTPIQARQSGSTKFRPNWSKLSESELLQGYTEEVESQLASLSLPSLSSLVSTPESIDSLLGEVTSILLSAAQKHIPAKRFLPFVKPGWTPELRRYHSKSKRLYKEWVRAGRPRSYLHPKRKQYKEAKAIFRIQLRRYQKDQRDAFFRNLDLDSSDPGRLFRHVRRANGGAAEPTTVLKVGDSNSVGEEIPDAWASYFADLASPRDHDPDFLISIEQQMTSISSLPLGQFQLFSEEEVDEVVKSLKVNKAAGPDDIDPEHLRFGGWHLVSLLTLLFNAMMLACHIPSVFRQGLVIPIPKGHNKDLSNPSNYRGITILSNMSKLPEKLVIWRISELNPSPTLNPLQGGFRSGHSCSHTALILQEAIASARESGSKAFVAFLDVKKAFDTVWHASLLVKLHQKGVTGHLWHVISTWYSSSSSCVLWDGTCSSSFVLNQGVRQGGTLSPFLYVLFVDELLDTLAASGLGVSVAGLYCGAPMYADDLALVSSRPADLQAMLDIVHVYSRKWRYQLNETKSVVMVFGEASATRRRERMSRKWLLGGTAIKEVDETHHLGILRSVSPSTVDRTNERASAVRSALNAVGSRFGCLHPLTSLKLYQALCLPIMLYGAEIWSLTKSELLILERVHRRILRTIQGLPLRCPSILLTKLLGISSIADLISQRSLGFIIATANLPSDSLARQVLVARAATPNAKGTIKRYRELLSGLSLPELSALLSTPPKNEPWKAFIKKNLALRAHVDFLETQDASYLGSCDLQLHRPAPHWRVTVGDPTLTRLNNFRIRLLVGCDGLEHDAARFWYRNTGAAPSDPSCKLCGHDQEDAVHFIAVCPRLENARLEALAVAPPISDNILPNRSVNPREYTEIMLGTSWIDDPTFQRFCISYLSTLKSRRAQLLVSGPF